MTALVFIAMIVFPVPSLVKAGYDVSRVLVGLMRHVLMSLRGPKALFVNFVLNGFDISLYPYLICHFAQTIWTKWFL